MLGLWYDDVVVVDDDDDDDDSSLPKDDEDNKGKEDIKIGIEEFWSLLLLMWTIG